MKKALLLILVSAVAVLFTTCSEPIDFVDSVATEVKVANDLFLVVESVAPADKDTGVNPGRDIEVQFDRPIRLDSVEATTFKIIKPDDSILSWKNPRFNTTTNTLYVEPTPYLEDTTGYSILVDGIIGTDGSVLQEDVIWSFVTGVAPVGSLTVASNNPKSITESTADGDLYYTDSTTISYTVEGNSILVTEGGEFLVSNTDLSALTDGELSALGGYKDYTTPANRTSTSYTIDSGDGDKYVYAVFRFYDSGSSKYVYSKVKNALVSLDTADPSLELGSTRYARTNLYIYPQSQNNVYSYQWSGSGLSYTASTSNYTYVSASSDNLYTIQLDVWDKAGNTVHDTATLVWDTVAPTVTSVLIDSGATYSTDTTVSAAYSFSDTTPDSSPSVSTYLVELWDSDNGYYGYEAATGWAKTESVTFSSHDNVSRYVYVHVKDPAGNISGWNSDYIYVDNVAPNPPTITTSTTVTGSNSLTWAWTSGGGGGGYQYHLYGASDTATSGTSFNYTASATIGREYRLYVQERDPAGNWSSADFHDIAYFPGGTYISPDHAAITVSRTTDVDWPSFYEINGSLVDGYYFYVWTGSTTMPKGTSYIDVSSSGYNNTVTLPGNTRFYWCYKPYSTFLTTKTVIAQSPTYYFTTALF